MKTSALKLNRGLVIAVLAVTAIWILLGLTDRGFLGHGVRVGAPNADTYHQTLLFQGGLQLKAVFGLIFLEVAAAIIGYVLVIRPIWGEKNLAPNIWLTFAGLIPGCLLIVPVSRLATLLLPNTHAPSVIFGVVLVVAALALTLWVRKSRPRPWEASDWRALGAGVLAVIAVLIFEVQLDRWHVAGEAILYFINKIFSTAAFGVGTAGHWPLLSQHYDEAAFLYPAIYGLMTPESGVKGTLTVLYWLHVGLGRLGAASLIYIALRGLGVDRLSSLVILLFVAGAALSVNPLSSRLLFDSVNPLAFALHVSRIVIPVLPLLMISAVANFDRRLAPWAILVAGLLGIGLASYAIHVALVLGWAVAALALSTLAPNVANLPRSWRAACAAGGILIVGFSLAYAGRGPIILRGVILFAAAAAASLAFAWPLFKAWRGRKDQDWRRVSDLASILGAMLAGYAAGVVFLGNVVVHKAAAVLGSAWPWAGVTILDRLPPGVVTPSPGVSQTLLCETGYWWTLRVLMGHCASLPTFVRTYGLALIAMTLFCAWRLHAMRRRDLLEGPNLTLAFWGMSLCLLAFPPAFLLLDFVRGGAAGIEPNFEIWLRSRLVEPWFYSGLMIAAALFFRQATRRERVWGQSLMLAAVAVWGLSPLLMPAQMIVNISYLMGGLARP